VVLGRGEREHRLAVGKGEERGLLALEELLDDDREAGVAEGPLLEAARERAVRLLEGAADRDALAGGEAVGAPSSRQ
jgi:hypothetical protein